jgi:hypothetical protein
MNRSTAIAIGLSSILIGGCGMLTPSSAPTDAEQRQSAALSDPMNYTGGTPKTVSGGSPFDDLNDIFIK